MFWALDHIIKKKTFVLKAEGTSMTPLLLPGDVVYYKKISFNKCQINDLIMVHKKNKLFTHRAIYKAKNYLVTKGDNNLESDGKIYPRQIVARVYQVKRNGTIFNPESLYLLQSTLYFQEIVKVKKAFEKTGIDFVFLKGLPLHLYFEKTHPRRIYLDCDVLINKNQFSRTRNILVNSGYKQLSQSLSKTHTLLRRKQTEAPLSKVINGFPVTFDIHLEIDWMSQQLGKLEEFYPQKLIDRLTNEFLATKREVKINGEKFSILNSEFLIIYLALHFFHHNFRGAFRLELLDRIIRHSGERKRLQNRFWTSQNDKIKQYRLQNFVPPVFSLLKKYYKTPIPASILQSQNPTSSLRHLPSIFDDEPRISAGTTRFKNLFLLSPNPLWKKMLVFLNPAVAYSIFWTIRRRLFSSFSNRAGVR